MPSISLLSYRLLLLWSIGAFAARIATAIALSQRVFVAILFLALAIASSAAVSRALIVDAAQESALIDPPAAVVANVALSDARPQMIRLNHSSAEKLWEIYKNEHRLHPYNRAIITNLILLASTLGLEKDVSVYQRKLHLSDPLLSCRFSNDRRGILIIECPTASL